jgi:hypothetical protein
MDPDHLELDQAFADVLAEAFHDEVPDVIRYADSHESWPSMKEELVTALKAGRYTPLPAMIVEVPKARLATRPIAVLKLRDRVVYQALMRRLAQPIDSFLPEEVRSARLEQSKSERLRMAKQPAAWGAFHRRGRELCEEYPEVCLLSTDITSYFEFIDLDRLSRDLLDVPGIDREAVKALMRLLRSLTGSTTNLHGVPQGPEVSSLLGNLYLMPIDATFRRLGLRFLRFQDDIKVFASEPHELRHALLELMPVVRSLHINLSSAKTKILSGDDVEEHFEDVRKDALQYGFDAGDPRIGEELQKFFDGAVSGDEVVERDVRFSVHRLQQLNDPHAVPWILANLDDVPYLASILVRYLSSQMANPALGIEPAIRSYLHDPKRNLSPIVEMQLIRMFANATDIDDETYDLVWKTLRDQNKLSSVRQFAARCIARHVRPGDPALIRATFQASVDNPELRRALLIGLYECGVGQGAFLQDVERSDESLRSTVRYLRGSPRLPRP